MSGRNGNVIVERLTSDHLPACPTCGDVAHPAASICESCAAPLFERDVYLGHLRLSRDRLGRFLKEQ